MSAPETILNLPDIKKLGIIAGGGDIPRALAECCEERGVDVFIVAFEGQTDADTTDGFEHIWTRLGAAGQIIKSFKNHDIHDIVMIGSIRRPSLAELKPDLKGAEIFARIGLQSLGDNDILSALKKEFSNMGISIHGAHHFLEDLLCKKGAIGDLSYKKNHIGTIKRGVIASQGVGRLDIGQSVIVQQNLVIGVEGIEGTDELIKRCKGYLRKGEGGVLVKTCKPNQDKMLDLPTIGPETVLLAAQNGLAGIIIEAHRSLIVNSERVAQLANKYKLFVVGIDLEEFRGS